MTKGTSNDGVANVVGNALHWWRLCRALVCLAVVGLVPVLVSSALATQPVGWCPTMFVSGLEVGWYETGVCASGGGYYQDDGESTTVLVCADTAFDSAHPSAWHVQHFAPEGNEDAYYDVSYNPPLVLSSSFGSGSLSGGFFGCSTGNGSEAAWTVEGVSDIRGAFRQGLQLLFYLAGFCFFAVLSRGVTP
jgi:hypothetical protein